MERPSAWPLAPAWTGVSDTWSYWSTLVRGIPGFFEPHLPAFWGAHIRLGVDRAGFYSTASLQRGASRRQDSVRGHATSGSFVARQRRKEAWRIAASVPLRCRNLAVRNRIVDTCRCRCTGPRGLRGAHAGEG